MAAPKMASPKPYAELTFSSIFFGIVLGLIFGVANTYLGLKVGLTISTSIPTAIMGVACYRLLRMRSHILETNMVQTIASSSSSVASGLIFTVPAFFLWGMDPGALRIFLIAIFGGFLGVLFMIPLRQYLIVREHENLPYPEGTACAAVLKASDEGGSRARHLFQGLGIGVCYQLLMSTQGLGLWPTTPRWSLPFLKKGEVSLDATPELLGVGFIVGPRIANLMVAGGVIGALVLVPLIAMIGGSNPEIAAMSAGAIRKNYVRYIGVGAVAAGGLLTLIKTLPSIWHSFVLGLKGMRFLKEAKERTQQDLPFRFIAVASVSLIVAMALLPDSLIPGDWATALSVFVCGFFFVTVASRIVGLVGVSSSPTSGMTIATLLITASIFMALGMTGDLTVAKAAILTVGGIVCSAASNAGDASQDLKTGYLVGATPYKQQIGEFVGVSSSAALLCFTIYLFKNAIQTGDLAAPQANMMVLVIDGILSHNVAWDLVFLGVFLVVVVELLGLPSLAFAIGLYLPLSLATPVFVGGLIRQWTERKRSEDSPPVQVGILISSGLIAGGALMGVVLTLLIALSVLYPAGSFWITSLWNLTAIYPYVSYIPAHPPSIPHLGNFGSLAMFSLLALYLYWVCRRSPSR